MSDAVVNGLAGAGGGMVAQIITYPLQTVNTRQQTERKLKADGNKNLAERTVARPKLPVGTLHQIYQVIREEGWGGLYSGLMPSMVGTAASQGVYYYFYQIFRTRAEATAFRHQKRGTGDGSVGMLSSLLSAALAGCLNVLLTNPIWVVVTRMQTQAQAQKKMLEAKGSPKERDSCDIKTLLVDSATENKLTIPVKLREHGSKGTQPYKTNHAVKDLYNEAGIKGFWKGVVPTLVMVCNPSIQFMIYEGLLQRLKAKRASNKEGLKNVTALEVFILGAIAKLGATVVTYPLLVVKPYLATCPANYALKVIRTDGHDSSLTSHMITREMDILRKIDSPSVVKCEAVFDEGGNMNFVLEYMDGDPLQRTRISESCLVKVARQMLEGLKYLHSHRIVHRDIKPANLLISLSGQYDSNLHYYRKNYIIY